MVIRVDNIVAAGAVVTRDIPPNSITTGVPVSMLRQIDENIRPNVWKTYVKNELPCK